MKSKRIDLASIAPSLCNGKVVRSAGAVLMRMVRDVQIHAGSHQQRCVPDNMESMLGPMWSWRGQWTGNDPQILHQRPSLRVIYMSGFTQEAIVQHGVLNPGIAFLHKPFPAETLGQKIGEALGT